MNYEMAKNKLKPLFLAYLQDVGKENFPNDIQAWWFGLYEPYGIYLLGSKEFDESDESFDWACPSDDDFCSLTKAPDLSILSKWHWQDVLKIVQEILTELFDENSDLTLLRISKVGLGFDDGDGVLIHK